MTPSPVPPPIPGVMPACWNARKYYAQQAKKSLLFISDLRKVMGLRSQELGPVALAKFQQKCERASKW